jgi:seryl-tRNA synthetase
VRYGKGGKTDDGKKQYVHMLNSTLVATERCLCCLLENYQTKGGIKVPKVLQPHMGGVQFIPFVNEMPKPKKGPAPQQFVPKPEQIAELCEEDAGKAALQSYMDGIVPALNAALNTIAKERPDDPLAALAAILGGKEGIIKPSAAAAAKPAEDLPEFDLAKAKAEEAEELKKKQEAEAKKAAEKAKLEEENIKRMQEMEGQGKKVAGGMHKFDASEVDVHGGSGTADDFLDAFGF